MMEYNYNYFSFSLSYKSNFLITCIQCCGPQSIYSSHMLLFRQMTVILPNGSAYNTSFESGDTWSLSFDINRVNKANELLNVQIQFRRPDSKDCLNEKK